MAFTQIMAIWTPGITLQDHLNEMQVVSGKMAHRMQQYALICRSQLKFVKYLISLIQMHVYLGIITWECHRQNKGVKPSQLKSSESFHHNKRVCNPFDTNGLPHENEKMKGLTS